MAQVRLFLDHPLGAGQSVPLTREQAHYLFGVMRLGVGADVEVFNGQDGAWIAEVTQAGKRGGAVLCTSQSQPQAGPPDLWLLFAPIKKARTDFIVEKAVELGAARIVPVLTDFTNSERVRVDRLQAHAVEAAEQCGITYVPQVSDPVRLAGLLDQWDAARTLIFCDEKTAGQSLGLPATGGASALLVGPEGGLSEAERARLQTMEAAHAISLGPRILRADTAVVAALTLWQAQHGDWA